jgi:Peptidase_G2, IMC autoproteolytic cleavage domain
MAYTIVKTNGQVLTTIADGTINTTSTSLALPGRNYAGYGQYLDTNFVHQLENYANSAPPPNPLAGQLWYDTNSNTMYVCPVDGTTSASSWLALTSTSSGGTTTFGAVTVTGNIGSNNITVTNGISADTITVRLATVTANATIANANVTTGNIGTLNSATITTGSASTAGTLTGTWTINGTGTANSVAGTGVYMNSGNIVINNSGNTYGIKTDKYMYANGTAISFSGTYNNGNVFDYLTGANTVTQFAGVIAPSSVTTANITTGGNTIAGQLTGNWTLTTGSRLNATYADLAERFEADAYYDAGTVVELGGDKEITSVKYELSEDIFGVISDTAAYLMNSGAGDNITHPPVAMTGRVQVKVTGIVKKSDRLVSAGKGLARAAQSGEATAFNVIGRALENKTTNDIGTVLAIVSVSK